MNSTKESEVSMLPWSSVAIFERNVEKQFKAYCDKNSCDKSRWAMSVHVSQNYNSINFQFEDFPQYKMKDEAKVCQILEDFLSGELGIAVKDHSECLCCSMENNPNAITAHHVKLNIQVAMDVRQMVESSAAKEGAVHFPLHVTFDSNTVEYVLGVKSYDVKLLGRHFDQRLAEAYAILRNAISTHKIVPYVSEGYFTIEAIEKKQRKSKMGKPAKTQTKVTAVSPNRVGMSFAFGPSVNVELNPCFAAVLDALKSAGGKVLPVYRMCFPICEEARSLHIEFGNGKPTFEEFQKRNHKIDQYIENELGGGLKHLKQVFQDDILTHPIPIERDNPFYRNSIREGATSLLFADNNLTQKKQAALIAELADCDMVCVHWAYDNDFICTCDISKGQGHAGILYSRNIKRLNEEFAIRVLAPCELASIIACESGERYCA